MRSGCRYFYPHTLAKRLAPRYQAYNPRKKRMRSDRQPCKLWEGIDRVNGRYVVDENGERVAVLLEIEEYERMVVQHHVPAAGDESPNEDEDLDLEEAERRIRAFVTSAE